LLFLTLTWSFHDQSLRGSFSSNGANHSLAQKVSIPTENAHIPPEVLSTIKTGDETAREPRIRLEHPGLCEAKEIVRAEKNIGEKHRESR
jgi:hypothetical protein